MVKSTKNFITNEKTNWDIFRSTHGKNNNSFNSIITSCRHITIKKLTDDIFYTEEIATTVVASGNR